MFHLLVIVREAARAERLSTTVSGLAELLLLLNHGYRDVRVVDLLELLFGCV